MLIANLGSYWSEEAWRWTTQSNENVEVVGSTDGIENQETKLLFSLSSSSTLFMHWLVAVSSVFSDCVGTDASFAWLLEDLHLPF